LSKNFFEVKAGGEFADAGRDVHVHVGKAVRF
jgi:hypothetical protein